MSVIIRIEETLSLLGKDNKLSDQPLPKARHRTKQPNSLSFDVRAALYQVLGMDLTQIHGLGPSLALKLISECGTDMSRWSSSKHFTSWLCLSPGNKESIILTNTAFLKSCGSSIKIGCCTIGKTNTALGAFYRRLSARIGKSKVITATARKMAVLFFNVLHYGMQYVDPGANYYEA
ncbi:MAG: transposase [Holosporales bacterium]|nr:transposase [Holosporales bacterium]